MIHAVIDMGSNSVRMSVYRCEDQEITLLMNQKRTIGLAGCVKNGLLTSEGIRRATQVLAEFKGIAEAFQIGSLSAFATASLRNIANQEQVLHELTLAAGITPEVISGEEEARAGLYRLDQVPESGYRRAGRYRRRQYRTGFI